MSGRLSGKFIAITGAAQGIGKAIAQTFQREGAHIFLSDVNVKALAETVTELSGRHGHPILSTALDIAKPDDVAQAFSKAQTDAGRPFDGLVNNAGINVFGKPLDTTDADWNRAFAVNLGGAWTCARAVLPGMIEQEHGVIVNIASTHAFTIIPETFPYPVVKHALMGLTKSLAIEYAAKGIQVNAIAPGYVATKKVLDWWADQPDPEAAKKETLALHPQGRIATPHEIANAALFMISGECPFMTGSCLTIDGGLSIKQHA